MSDTQDSNVKAKRTRRNILRTGPLAASAIVTLALTKGGVAQEAPAPEAPHDGGRCLLRGTAILTTDGYRKVEELAVGDLLPTMFRGTQPIQWIGRYPIKKSDPSKPWAKDARPVRIARSSLAPNVPQADVYVTQAHAVFIDDVLVSAGFLVNETTITLCEARELSELEFFHIKLESHDVIYAEGAPVETLLNVDESAVNFADYFRTYGVPNDSEAPCLPMLVNWRASGFKSRFCSAISWNDRRKRIALIHDRLEERARAVSKELESSL